MKRHRNREVENILENVKMINISEILFSERKNKVGIGACKTGNAHGIHIYTAIIVKKRKKLIKILEWRKSFKL